MLLAISMAQPCTIERRIRALDKRVVFATLSIAFAAIAPLSMAQLGAAAPAPAAPAPAAAAVDLTTPEASIRSFVAALNRADLEGAARCVLGGKAWANPILAKRFDLGRPHFEVSGVVIAINGETATATIAQASVTVANNADSLRSEEKVEGQQLLLRREGDSWKIAVVKKDDAAPKSRPALFEGIATLFTLSDIEIAAYVEGAERSRSMNNLKQLTLATIMYAEEHGGRLDFNTETAPKALLPALQNNESLFTATEGKSRFVFNGKLSGATLAEVKEPARMVVFYEAPTSGAAIGGDGIGGAIAGAVPAGGQLYFGTNGRAAVSFADGHVSQVDKAEAARLLWER